MRIPGLCPLLLFIMSQGARAELPALEEAIAPVTTEIAEAAPTGKIVVAVRALSAEPCPVHVALANELTLALSGLQRDAASAATDSRTESLVDGREAFDGKAVERIKRLENRNNTGNRYRFRLVQQCDPNAAS